MSFTVYKRKMNGEMVPIKMSIWDAFHGCHNPKPKKKDPCSCCGKYHGLTDNARSQFEKDECVRNGGTGGPGKQLDWKGKDKTEPNKGGEGGNKPNGFSTSEEETFTDQDDVIIMRMKTDGDSWANILKAINKSSKSQVQARYKQLEGKPGVGKTDDNKPDGDGTKDDKKSKAEKDKAESLKKQAEGKKDKEGMGKKDKGKGQDKKDGKAADSKSNDTAVKAWADRYDKQKWVAMASKHFDKTGQRITPEQARKLAEGK